MQGKFILEITQLNTRKPKTENKSWKKPGKFHKGENDWELECSSKTIEAKEIKTIDLKYKNQKLYFHEVPPSIIKVKHGHTQKTKTRELVASWPE